MKQTILESGYSIFLTAIFFITFPISSHSQVQISPERLIKKHAHADERMSDYRVYQLDLMMLRNAIYAAPSRSEENIRLNLSENESYSLTIEPRDIRSADYKLMVATDHGTIELPRSANQTFRGYRNTKDQDVRLTISEGFISGFITIKNRDLYIESYSNYDKTAGPNEVVVYFSDHVIAPENVSCAHDSHNHPQKKKRLETHSTSQRMACKEVQIAIANDFMMFQDYGSVSAVESHNMSVINNVESNYDNEFSDDLQFSVTGIFVPSSEGADPFPGGNNISTMLSNFRSWGQQGNFGVTYDVASLWSPRNFTHPDVGPGVIGLAYVGVICSSFRYNVLEDFSNNANLLRVLQAHEMGHNFDADHSDASSIMGPNVTNTSTWSSDSQNEINAHIGAIGCLGPCAAGAPPGASFSADQTFGCTPFEISFFDNSSNTPTEWLWTFEGGTPSSSTDANPIVTYSNPGLYNVTLEVTNAFGTDVLDMQEYIEIEAGPTADFFYNVNGIVVDFENFSENYTSLLWDFGDGSTSTDVNPTHTYDEDGFYPVTLTVNNDCGTSNFSLDVQILTPPSAGFSSNLSQGCLPLTVQFNNESTNNVDFFLWSFEGGNPSTSNAINPIVTYSTPGQYEVTLLVSNDAGDDEVIQTDFITVFALPQAEFIFSESGLEVMFSATAYSNNGYSWDFGDGNNGTGQNVTHTYQAGGSYEVTLTTSNECGDDFVTETIILNSAPSAGFTSNQTTGCEPFAVQFSSTSVGAVSTYNWSFEGGSPATSNLSAPLVTYSTPGVYQVQLTVTNDVGSDQLVIDDYITVLPQATSDFGYSVDQLQISFANLSQFGEDYLWDFGDGNTSIQTSPTHQYAEDGEYIVQLITLNSCGSDTSESTVLIATAPTAGFSANQNIGCAPFLVAFQNESTANANSFVWTFEGGTPASSTDENPVVQYATAGVYDVQLEVTSLGGSDLIVQSDYVQVGASPIAEFVVGMQDALMVTFNNTSSNYQSSIWDFGDGTTSTDENPTHTYASFGAYLVQLIVTNECGSDTTDFPVTVTTSPITQFTSSEQSGCLPVEITFQDQSTNNPTSWEWTFEGGSPASSTDQNPTVLYMQAGQFDVKLRSSNSEGSSEILFIDYISIGQEPDALFEYEINGSQVEFSSTSIDASGLNWNFGNGMTSVDENLIIDYGTGGDYLVQLIATNECGSDTIEQLITIVLTSTAELLENILQIYPNPTLDYVFLGVKNQVSLGVTWSLFDMHGKLVASKNNITIGESTPYRLDMVDFPSGVYHLGIVSKDERIVSKIVKIR